MADTMEAFSKEDLIVIALVLTIALLAFACNHVTIAPDSGEVVMWLRA